MKTCFIRVILLLLLIVFLFSLGCSDDDKNTKPTLADTLSKWQKVSTFGDEAIYAVKVNADSTILNVVTANYQGYHLRNNHFLSFDKINLEDKIYPKSTTDDAKLTNSIPYLVDDKMFYCDRDLQTMFIYEYNGLTYDKVSSISLDDLVTEELNFTIFGRSHWVNLPNHIVKFDTNKYIIFVESHILNSFKASTDDEEIRQKYRMVGIELDNSNKGYSILFEKETFNLTVDCERVFSTHLIDNTVIQFHSTSSYFADVNSPMIISPEGNITSGNCQYPCRDIITDNGFYYGLGDGVINRSSDLFNWDDYTYINGSWSYGKVAGHNILFRQCSFADMIDFETLEFKQLETIFLDDYRTFFTAYNITEFNGLVYVGTNYGLYVRSIESFLKSYDKSDYKNQTLDLSLQP